MLKYLTIGGLSVFSPIDEDVLQSLIVGDNIAQLEDRVLDGTFNTSLLYRRIAEARLSFLTGSPDRETLLSLPEEITGHVPDSLVSFTKAMRFQFLYAQEDYSTYLTYIDPKVSQPYFEEIRARIKLPSSVLQSDGTFSMQVLEHNESIQVKMEDRKLKLAIDTGSLETLISADLMKKLKLYEKGHSGRFYYTLLPPIIGANFRLDDIRASVVLANPLKKQLGSRTILLGLRDLVRFESLTFIVNGDQITHIQRSAQKPVTKKEGPSNLYYDGGRLWIRTVINKKTYTCRFDNAGGGTLISTSMFDRVQSDLELKEGPEKRLRSLRRRPEDLRTIKALPITVAGKDLVLNDVFIRNFDFNDYCYIGTDAIIAAGGLTLDFVNMQAVFGPPTVAPLVSLDASGASADG